MRRTIPRVMFEARPAAYRRDSKAVARSIR